MNVNDILSERNAPMQSELLFLQFARTLSSGTIRIKVNSHGNRFCIEKIYRLYQFHSSVTSMHCGESTTKLFNCWNIIPNFRLLN